MGPALTTENWTSMQAPYNRAGLPKSEGAHRMCALLIAGSGT